MFCINKDINFVHIPIANEIAIVPVVMHVLTVNNRGIINGRMQARRFSSLIRTYYALRDVYSDVPQKIGVLRGREMYDYIKGESCCTTMLQFYPGVRDNQLIWLTSGDL